MHQRVTRIITLAVILFLLGCSGGGNPTAPPVDNQADQDPSTTGDQVQELTLTPDYGDVEERIIGNFYYTSDDDSTLAWGTVFLTQEGWEYKIDYIGPKLQALRRSDVTREAQAIIDLRWLHLISCGVSYTNKPVPIPPDLAEYETGELMEYRVDIQNNINFNIYNQTVAATQVNMFNLPLGLDARDVWENVNIPVTGLSLFGDWVVEPWLDSGIYYTRVRVSFNLLGGLLTILIFDAKAGAFEVLGGPDFFDPVARGVTTTPVVAVGENVHVQDNGSFDPDGGPITLFEWDFNNDGTWDATGPMADTSYPAPGVYYVNLRVTDDEGATDDLTDDPDDALIEITVTPPPVPPVAIAEASTYEAFVGEPITFDGTDSYDPDGGSIVLYEWDWEDDGTYDNLGGITIHAYSAPGTYHVQLRVTDDEVQTDTLDVPLEIVITEEPVPPGACFAWSPEDPVPCETITFDASCSEDSDGEIVLYEWDFDNDGVPDVSTPDPVTEHSFDSPGEYTVTLRVTDDDGLTDITQAVVTVVNALPTSMAWASKYSADVDEDIYFYSAYSHDNDCNNQEIVLFEWDFDFHDPDFTVDATGPTPVHSYDTPGTYYVQLRVTDDEGGTDLLDTPLEIVVTLQFMDPIAYAASDSNTVSPCYSIHFYDDGSYDPDGGAIQLYEWDWDNDGTYDETGDEAYHSFDSPGSYEVNFRVTDDEGATDEIDELLSIIVENALPTAVATASKYEAEPDEIIVFDGTGSYDNDCSGHEIVHWEWDWENDGIFDDTGASIWHWYSEPGIYHVNLRVTDNEGGTATLDIPLEIEITSQLTDPVALALPTSVTETKCVEVHLHDNGSYDPDGGTITLYEWDIDNDGIYEFTGTDLYYTWTVPGIYYVQLRVTDDEGATDTLDIPIEVTIVSESPTAVAEADKYSAYVDELITFNGSGSHDNDCDGEIISWEWDFENDGTYDAAGEIVSHSYPSPGTYLVQLQVTDDEGETDTLDSPLEIIVSLEFMDPIAYAANDPISSIPCYSIHFYDDGSYDPDGGAIQLYEWDWDNDGTYDETGDDTYHTFDTPGTYQVNFRVTDDEGATDEIDSLLEVFIENALPTAVATASKYEAEVNEIITFDGTGSYDNDCNGQEIVQWEWDWENDGIFDDTGSMIWHWYTAPGTYYVNLRVTDDEGGQDTLDVPLVITIVGPDQDPIAMAGADPTTQGLCEDVHFFDDGSYDPDGGLITLYEWDFDGDGTYDATGSDAYHAYTIPGTYYAQLRVTDDEGATDTLDTPIVITIENASPTASAVADKYTADVGETIEFDGSSSFDDDSDCGDSIVSYEWDLDGDGTWDTTGAIINYAYSAAGTYYVQLRVTDSYGAQDLLDTPLEIIISAPQDDPVALAGADPNPQIVCEEVHLFDNGSYDPDGGSIVLFEWDIDNDGTYEFTGSDIYYSWNTIGTKFVQLRVTDDEGATDTLDLPLEIMIENAIPTAVGIAYDYNPTVCQTVYFDGSGSYDNDCGGDAIVTWEWDFEGNGSFVDGGMYPSYSYDSVGNYIPSLRVTDDEGGTDTTVLPMITVENALPSAVGTADDYNPTVCQTVNFDGSGSYDNDCGGLEIVKWEWDFEGDGTFVEASWDTSYSYDSVDNIIPALRVTDDEGGTHTANLPEISVVNADPTSVASASTYEANPGQIINFDGSGSFDNDCDGDLIVSWEWDWDNDGVYEDTGEFADHAYSAPGTYLVQLRVTDDEGGQDTLDIPLEILITVEPVDPVALGTADPTTQNLCDDVHFYDTGSYDPDGGSITLYEWDFDGDGTYDATGPDVYHAYTIPGTYYAQLRVTDDEGATDTLDTPIEIIIENTDPTASAVSDNYAPFTGEQIQLDGTGSSDPDSSCGDTIDLYEWDLNNDGTYDKTGPIVTHSYDTAGTYYVQLRVTDSFGGQDTLDVPLEIVVSVELLDPIADGAADPTTQTVCEEVHFFDNGSYDPDGGLITLYEWDFDGDGTYDTTGPDVYYAYSTPGVYYAQLRVTDDEGATDTLDTPLEITIENALPTASADVDDPVGLVDDPFYFDGLASTDNDCGGDSIVLYEWDFDWDGVIFTVDDSSGPEVSHSYDTPGTYDVMLRVTDNEGGTDMLDEPITVTVILTDCPTGIHSFNPANQRGVSTGYSMLPYSVMPRADIAYIESGVWAGKGIVQGGPNSLVSFDPDVDNDDPIDDAILSYPTGAAPGDVLVTSLDASPVDGLAAVVTSDLPGELRILDTTVIVGSFYPYSFNFGTEAKIMAVDFEADGDLWVVVKDGSQISLYYSEYLGGATYYSIWSSAAIDGAIGSETDVFDIAVNWTNNLIYLFDAGTDNRGRVTAFNPTTYAIEKSAIALFDSIIDYVSDDAIGAAGFADMEIDHQGADENCHIVLYGRINAMTSEVRKFDEDMVLVNSNSYTGIIWPSMTINPESVSTDRDLMAPHESTLGFWDPPVDW